MPPGICPLAFAFHENFSDASRCLFPFTDHFHLQNVLAPDNCHIAKMLDLGAWKLEANQFSACRVEVRSRLQHFRLVPIWPRRH
jgi:hypothetical protein